MCELQHKNIMDKGGGFGPKDRFPSSRDFGLDSVKCAKLKCVANTLGECISPASIKIKEDGTCGGYSPRKGKK